MSHPLQRLRLRFAAWYIGTYVAILILSRAVLLLLLLRSASRELDLSLHGRIREVVRGTASGVAEGVGSRRAVRAAADEVSTPRRVIFVVDRAGRMVYSGGREPGVLRAAASDALSGRTVALEFSGPQGQELRLHGRRVRTGDGEVYAVLALADAVEVQQEYDRVMNAFAVSAFLVLLLVAVGGWRLAVISTAPVERMMEQMRRFMADAAHELRTPIAVLRSRAELMLERERSAAAYAAALEEIAREATRMGAVVDDLFTLARADAGERIPVARPLYLDDLVSDAVSAAGPLAQSRGVRLELVRFDESAVHGDPTLLRQLVMILLDNAIKFTPAGGRVSVGTHPEPGGGLVEVRDTGIGIPAADVPHIFDRFFRGSAGTGETGGAGLGLSIARWIAEAHGGRIEVESAPGHGTRMTVRIPSTAPAARRPALAQG